MIANPVANSAQIGTFMATSGMCSWSAPVTRSGDQIEAATAESQIAATASPDHSHRLVYPCTM
jgi:hypothetical protein